MSETRDWNAEIIAEFRANKGEVKAPYDNPPPMLLLHTIGARSGRDHGVPMRAMVDGETLMDTCYYTVNNQADSCFGTL
jgi:hypothetical protein